MLVEIDEELYQKIKLEVETNKVEYPNIKNFVNKAVKKQLEQK